jgi:hypothetical protein
MSWMRLARSTLEIALFLAPIAGAFIAAVLTFVFWPGGIVGGAILLGIAWLCHRKAERIGREHHW